MSSSPFVFPHGDGCQSLHGMGVQSRQAEKEIPASVLESVKPLVPEWKRAEQTGWVCPAGLGRDPWRSPLVRVDIPAKRKMGIHVIDIEGHTDAFNIYQNDAPDMRVVVDGKEFPGYSPVSFSLGGSDVQYSYQLSMATSTQGTVSVSVILRHIGAEWPQSLPCVGVHDIGLKVTSIWF